MEAPIRCKFFDDDGTPIGPGCPFRSRCRFIHPTDPVWNSIMPYRPPRPRASPPPHARRLPDSRDAPSSRQSSYNDTNTRVSGASTSSWGEQGGWGSWTDSDSGWGQPWDQGTSKAQTSTNKSSSNDSGWGQGWGQSTVKAQPSANKSSDNDSGWGQTWDQGTSKAESSRSFASRASTNSPSVLQASPAMPHLRHHDRGRELHKSTNEVDMKDVSQVPAPKETKRPVLHTKLQQRALDYKPSSPVVPMHISGLITRRGDEISAPQVPLASQTPKQLYANLVKELVDVVITRYKLLKAEDKKMRWRGARQSSCYHHSAPAAREILDKTYQDFIDTIGILTKQLNTSLKKVVQYSDTLNTHKEKITEGLNVRNIMSYTSDLRDWIVNVDLQRRLGNTKAFIRRKEEAKAMAKQRRQEEMDNIENAMSELELKATNIWDELCQLDTSLPERFNEEFIIAKNAMKENDTDPDLNRGMLTDMGIGEEDIRMVRNKAEMMDQIVDNFTTKSLELQARIKSLEEEVAELRQKDSEINEFRRDAHVQLRQMDAWRLEDKQKLDRIHLMVENLNLNPRSTPPAPANAVDLASCINELVTQYVVEEVKPALDAIVEACEKGNQRAGAELDKSLEQIVTKTYDLVQMALKANGLFPQIVPHSS